MQVIVVAQALTHARTVIVYATHIEVGELSMTINADVTEFSHDRNGRLTEWED